MSQKNNFNILEKGDPFEAAGAGEDKMKAILANKCSLFLGRHLIGQQSFVLLDMQHLNATLVKEGVDKIDGILGNDFLRKHKVIIDYAEKRMTF
jgi:hypothetical protein